MFACALLSVDAAAKRFEKVTILFRYRKWRVPDSDTVHDIYHHNHPNMSCCDVVSTGVSGEVDQLVLYVVAQFRKKFNNKFRFAMQILRCTMWHCWVYHLNSCRGQLWQH